MFIRNNDEDVIHGIQKHWNNIYKIFNWNTKMCACVCEWVSCCVSVYLGCRFDDMQWDASVAAAVAVVVVFAAAILSLIIIVCGNNRIGKNGFHMFDDNEFYIPSNQMYVRVILSCAPNNSQKINNGWKCSVPAIACVRVCSFLHFSSSALVHTNFSLSFWQGKYVVCLYICVKMHNSFK